MFKNLEALIDEKELRPGSLAAKNQLLTELLASTEARNLLFPQLRIVPLERNQVLYEQGDAIETVYFPIDSIVSSLAIMEDGTTLETSMVGREGSPGSMLARRGSL